MKAKFSGVYKKGKFVFAILNQGAFTFLFSAFPIPCSDHFPVTELKRVNRLDSLQHLPSSRKVPNRLCIIWLQSPEWSQLMVKLMGNENECTAAAELCPFNNTQATSNHFLSAEMKLPPRQNMEEHLSPLFYKCSTTSQVGRERENVHQD